jgi:CheY-like chemotaxis protein
VKAIPLNANGTARENEARVRREVRSVSSVFNGYACADHWWCICCLRTHLAFTPRAGCVSRAGRVAVLESDDEFGMKSILVLEDDTSTLQNFTLILWSKGYSVLEAVTAREAFDAAKRQPRIDLFVADVGLKGENISGTEVAVALARKHENLPVVFVSGTPLEFWSERDRRNMRLLLRVGVEVLEKPFLLRVFEDAVDRLVGQSSTTFYRAKHSRGL